VLITESHVCKNFQECALSFRQVACTLARSKVSSERCSDNLHTVFREDRTRSHAVCLFRRHHADAVLVFTTQQQTRFEQANNNLRHSYDAGGEFGNRTPAVASPPPVDANALRRHVFFGHWPNFFIWPEKKLNSVTMLFFSHKKYPKTKKWQTILSYLLLRLLNSSAKIATGYASMKTAKYSFKKTCLISRWNVFILSRYNDWITSAFGSW